MAASRSGESWTLQEALTLYRLVLSGKNSDDAEQKIGRSERACEYKLIDGGYCTEDHIEILPRVSERQFIRNLRKKRIFSYEEIAPHQRSGKTSKIFNKATKFYDGIHCLPVNKLYLVPLLSKKQCRIKHESTKKWWRFSSDAQANPHMRSQSYKKYNGNCALCNRPLSEGEFQAHHSCYDHICTFGISIYAKDSRQRKISIPDCQTCHASSPKIFEECLKRLHAVHGACNKKLYDIQK